MNEEDKKKIEEIMAGMKCPKDFQCAKSGFTKMCKVRKFGVEDFQECLEKRPGTCSFAMPYGDGHFCQCPLRGYVCKKLEK